MDSGKPPATSEHVGREFDGERERERERRGRSYGRVLANITEGEKVCSGEITRDNMQKLNWKIITGSLLRAALMGFFVLPAR
ncbi:hypothetical protein WN944_014096 [Citrus x changshan-huyou]|uniref:Uncharacterized protein n=1 Tax=Citrus x changshan-huyou TaxID=2935761 RepID=A0AAP0MA02_9ROSI